MDFYFEKQDGKSFQLGEPSKKSPDRRFFDRVKYMNFYTVILTFPKNVEEELKKLRRKYNKYTSYSIDPHITLKQPFRPIVASAIIDKKLRAVAERTKPFNLILNRIEYFEGANNVAYAAIKNKKSVIGLHTDIVRSLKGLVKEKYKEEFELEKFLPHATISEEIPNKAFPVIKKELSSYKLKHKIKIDFFSLYFEGKKEIWKPAGVFKFSKK